MADISCPNCHAILPLQTIFCTHCQTDIAHQKRGMRLITLNYNMLVPSALVVLVFCGTWMLSDSAMSSLPERPTATAKADAIAFYHQIRSINQCDQPNVSLSPNADTEAFGDAYHAAEAISSGCQSTYAAIRALEIPTSLGKKAYASMAMTIDICADAYAERKYHADILKISLGTCNPSIENINSIQANAVAASDEMILCSTGLAVTAELAGITEADLAGKNTH